MHRVVHFDIPADDPERAAAFYSEVFGWEFSKWDGPQEYWLITTGADPEPGINGGLVRREETNQGIVNTIDVPSVAESTAKIEGNGGTVLMSKVAIPGIGWFASCQDPEGNVFGLIQPDPSAK